MKDVKDWKKINWIASYPKSGNTWVRCLLDAYFFGELDINDISSCRADDHVFWSYPKGSSFIEDAPDEIKLMERTFGLVRSVEGYSSLERANPMYMKTHTSLVNVDGQDQVPVILTNSIVYIVRDPRKIVSSYASHFNVSIDTAIEEMSQINRALVKKDKMFRMPTIIGSWSFNVASYLNQKEALDILIVRYEDLVKDTEFWFTEILKKSLDEVDAQKVKVAVELSKLDKLRKEEEQKGFCERPEHTTEGFFGGKRQKPTDKQILTIEETFKEDMKLLGYL